MDSPPAAVRQKPAVSDPLEDHIIPSTDPSIMDQDPANPRPLPQPLVKPSTYIAPEPEMLVTTPAPASPPAAPPRTIIKLIVPKAAKAATASVLQKHKRVTRSATAKQLKASPPPPPAPAPKKAAKRAKKSSVPAKQHRIPAWGVMFAKTGYVPSGEKKTTGTLKGHFGKEACRGAAPAGVEKVAWDNKFRSVEDSLMKQLVKVYGDKKKAKEVLDGMRDSGWVRDRAVDGLKVLTAEEKKAKKDMAFVTEDLSQWED